MRVQDFNYDLPESQIAQEPVEPRDKSRLLVLDIENGGISHHTFFQLEEFLKPEDVLIFNDTRVIPARLFGARTDTGGRVEVFLLQRKSASDWEVLVRPGRKLRPGAKITFSEELTGEILDVTEFGGRVIRFFYEGQFEVLLDRLGNMPLPPYIKKPLCNKERYQTVYAKYDGSAAAPTAGLHFTESLLQRLSAKGISFGYVTLHVGLGTFRPVSVENVEDHVMHREYYVMPQKTLDLIENTKKQGGRVIAVGTTAVRTMETVAQRGSLEGWTDIFIRPGYSFRYVDGMITNFHLPQSTLLMLVSAMAGKDKIFQAYEEAVQLGYRFFSFGDAMLII